jgi:dolichyl-phosphate-mannose--protein O-mannosyl transferase
MYRKKWVNIYVFRGVHVYILFYSVKYVGLFTAILVLYLIWRDYWKLLSDFTKSDVSVAFAFIAYIMIRLAIYLI